MESFRQGLRALGFVDGQNTAIELGRKSHAERNPELVVLARRLHRQKPKGGRLSLRAISAELAAAGFLNENGQPFAAASVKSMVEG